MQGVLIGDEALAERLTLAFHRGHHVLQTVDEGGHDRRLLLKQLQRGFALMLLREAAQCRNDACVERLHDLCAFLARECGEQAEHGRRSDTRDRRPEREAESLDRRGERGANRLQIGRAFERDAGATQRGGHAEEGAEHAEQHEQADEIGRERRAGQADAFAFHAQTHSGAKTGGQRLEPRGQGRGRRV